MLESFYHVLYAMGKVNADVWEVLAYLILVLFWGKLVPLLILAWIWDSMRRWSVLDWIGTCKCCAWHRYLCCFCCPCFNDPVYAHALWAPLEVLTGLSFFFLFGLGVYVAPTAITIAGIVRLSELKYVLWRRRYIRKVIDNDGEKVVLYNLDKADDQQGLLSAPPAPQPQQADDEPETPGYIDPISPFQSIYPSLLTTVSGQGHFPLMAMSVQR